MNLALPPFDPQVPRKAVRFVGGLMALWALIALACLCSGCMTPLDQADQGEHHDVHEYSNADSSLVQDIRSAGVDRQSAANYADLFAGFASLCDSPALKSTEDLKRAEVNGLKLLGQSHTQALVPIAEREFACMAHRAALDDSKRRECREAFERFAAAMREVAK